MNFEQFRSYYFQYGLTKAETLAEQRQIPAWQIYKWTLALQVELKPLEI